MFIKLHYDDVCALLNALEELADQGALREDEVEARRKLLLMKQLQEDSHKRKLQEVR